MAPASHGRRRTNRIEGTFDTALGWQTGNTRTRLVRLCICAVLLFVFAAPIMTVVVGAFDLNADPTRLTLWPRNPSLANFEVATRRGIWGYFENSLLIAGLGLGSRLNQVHQMMMAAIATAEA
jgi:multiple sugar transport system permease protein